MKNIKKTITFGVVLAVFDVAILWILKIMEIIEDSDFSNLIKDSLSIIGIVVLVGIVLSLIFNFNKKV